jgi:hypothetical protein
MPAIKAVIARHAQQSAKVTTSVCREDVLITTSPSFKQMWYLCLATNIPPVLIAEIRVCASCVTIDVVSVLVQQI